MTQETTTAASSPRVTTEVVGEQPAKAPAVAPEFQRLIERDHQVGVFSDPDIFKHAQRVATMLVTSKLAPAHFQGEENLGSAVIAVDMAFRLNMNPLMVMQQLYVVHGKPGWSAQFVIAVINASGKFTPLRFKYSGSGENMSCIAYATDKVSGEVLESTPVSMDLARKEGWVEKNGSKWKSMPEQMMTYRSASFWGRVYAPELTMGLPSVEEIRDGSVETSESLTDAPKTNKKPDMASAAAAVESGLKELKKEIAKEKEAPKEPAKPKATEPDAKNIVKMPAAEPPKEAAKEVPKSEPKPEATPELPKTEPAKEVVAPTPEPPAPAAPTAPAAEVAEIAEGDMPEEHAAIAGYLKANNVPQAKFLYWLANCGRFPTAEKVGFLGIPAEFMGKLSNDTKALGKCVGLYGVKV